MARRGPGRGKRQGPSRSNNSREGACKIPDEERCCVTVELHKETTIQGFKINESGRCMKKGKTKLTNTSREEHLFCGVHKRMALEGKIGPVGTVMPKNNRSDCYMHDIPYFHVGEWSETP